MSGNENRCFSLLDRKENITVGGKAKLDGRKTTLYGSGARKRLADISNIPKHSKLATGEDKSTLSLNSDNIYTDKLQKENASLLTLLEDKNKIIELSGSELQKLIVNMQKMQQQNFQLAQANSLMLAELNASKDRLKAMQHQLGCTNSLLRVKEMEQKEQLNIRICQQCENQAKVGTSKSEKDVLEIVEAHRDQINPRSTNWKRQLKSQSLDHSTLKHVESTEKTDEESVNITVFNTRYGLWTSAIAVNLFWGCPYFFGVCLGTEPASFKSEAEPEKEDMVLWKEKAENKRLLEPKKEDVFLSKEKAEKKRGRPRRNSAIYNHEEIKPKVEDMLEITDTAKSSVCSSSFDGKESSIGQSLNSDELRRSSIARPSRLATKKVQCYKEIPVNVKMRRPE